MNLESIMDYELFGTVRVIVVLVFGSIIVLSLFFGFLVWRTFKKIDKEEGNK